jgi:hypothetical protein
MQKVSRLHVTFPFVALKEDPRYTFITIPAGSIIESAERPEDFGLISVSLEGKEIWAFTRDLRLCCTP